MLRYETAIKAGVSALVFALVSIGSIPADAQARGHGERGERGEWGDRGVRGEPGGPRSHPEPRSYPEQRSYQEPSSPIPAQSDQRVFNAPPQIERPAHYARPRSAEDYQRPVNREIARGTEPMRSRGPQIEQRDPPLRNSADQGPRRVPGGAFPQTMANNAQGERSGPERQSRREYRDDVPASASPAYERNRSHGERNRDYGERNRSYADRNGRYADQNRNNRYSDPNRNRSYAYNRGDGRHADRGYYRSDHRAWNRHDWRRDRRYDWWGYRNSNRYIFRVGAYYSPYSNYGYRRFGIGYYLLDGYFTSRYWIHDPWQYRLPAAYGPYRWVRYYDDALLVDIYSGEVIDIVYNIFW